MNQFSKFNVVNKGCEYSFVYNTLSGAFVKISTKIFNNIWDERYSKERESLLEQGIVTNDENEIYKYRYQSNNAIYNDKELALYITPTMTCNFSCFYCFEGEIKTRGMMSQKVEDSIVKFLEKNKERKISIIWFGGEPLLGFKNIMSIVKKLRKRNIAFESSMITNGSLLTKSKIRCLEELNLTNIQISLDGPKEIHDERRFFKHSKKGTFEIILSNIEDVLSSTSIPITIQVAIDKTNNFAYAALLEMLNNKFPLYMKNRRIRVGYNIVQDRTGFDKKSLCNTSNDQYHTIIDLFHLDIKNKMLPALPSRILPCMYRSTSCFAIDDKGDVFKCIEHLGKPDKKIGNIVEGFISLQKMAFSILEKDPFEDLQCKNCNVFPVCGGGCPIDTVEKGEKDCSFHKTELEKLLPYFYDLYSE
ncbi:radical SAM protein [Marinifilum sp.]|uniref:radical SAM protein n=1 Tax=Marinifilum sp. TaxID=2033137 RepID=UPI003BAC9700